MPGSCGWRSALSYVSTPMFAPFSVLANLANHALLILGSPIQQPFEPPAKLGHRRFFDVQVRTQPCMRYSAYLMLTATGTSRRQGQHDREYST